MPPEVSTTLFALALFGLGAYFTIRLWTQRVILAEDSIEWVWRYGRRRLLFSEIEGRRLRVNTDSEGTSTYHVLVPNDDRLEEIALEDSFHFDRAFWHWFNGLPDLDEYDRLHPLPPEKERLAFF